MGNWRMFWLRRLAAGRLRIDDWEAARIQPGWLWPYWLERQLDPSSPAFIPRGHWPFPVNVTQRNWTLVGNVGSRFEAIVDPRGLVTPRVDGWSLDWWVGAEDRWHLPSREPAVRQRLVGSAPVIETAMRVPGGDAVQRVYAVAADEGLVLVEIENRSPTPVAVAFALRPYHPEGLAVVERIATDGDTVLADGRPALLLPRPPAGVAWGTFAGGDCVTDVVAGRARPGSLPPVRDPAGLAQAAFVYPLPHRTSLRVAVPFERSDRTRRRRLARRRARTMPAVELGRLPWSADVARSWEAQLRRGLRPVLPDPRLQEAVDANRAYLLLFHDRDEITPVPFTHHRFSFRDAAHLIATLDRYGFHGEAAEVLRSYPRRQPRDRFFPSRRREWDANGAAIWAIAEHHRLTRDSELLDELYPAVRRGAAEVPRHCGRHYRDDFWALRGHLDAAWLARQRDDTATAAAARDRAAALQRAITASLETAAGRLGRTVMPAGPRRGVDAGMIGSLVACSPLGLLPADDPWVAGTLDVIRDQFCRGEAFFQSISRTGLGTYLTLQIAACELEAGDARAWRRLRWMLDVATATFTWPEAVHPRLGGGSTGDGHHGWAAAEFLSFVRRVLVRETPEGALALLSVFPPEWAGHDVEVHRAPTHHGLVSYALRWHGDRPALLWECDVPGVRLTVPGLDRSWASTDRSGEALLAPYRRRVPLEVDSRP